MHIEFLVEDRSGEVLLEKLLPRILGPLATPHTWRLHAYRGIGRIPEGLAADTDPSKRVLLGQLPRILRGYGRTPGIDAVVVVLDADRRDCRVLLSDLMNVVDQCDVRPTVLFRIAIEEMEAWYLGDRAAILAAYPRARREFLDRYEQDSVCGTWELLADAIYPGGRSAVRRVGWPLPGQIKCEWAERIGPLMGIQDNLSPSFQRFRDGLLRLSTPGAPDH